MREKVRGFLQSSFQTSTKLEIDGNLDKYLTSLDIEKAQAGWRNLSVDAWTGGKVAPLGAYVDYAAEDEKNKPIRGGAFFAFLDKIAELHRLIPELSTFAKPQELSNFLLLGCE